MKKILLIAMVSIVGIGFNLKSMARHATEYEKCLKVCVNKYVQCKNKAATPERRLICTTIHNACAKKCSQKYPRTR